MVVMRSWKASPLGKGRLLKTCVNLVTSAMEEASIDLNDIALIVHSGIYRQHFRTEPAFATHLQGALKLKCTTLTQESSHCFAFDVSDGSCSAHIALDAIADLLPQFSGKYAILCVGDERPNKQTEWTHTPHCFVAILALEGTGPRLERVSFDETKSDPERMIISHFDHNKKANISIEYGEYQPQPVHETDREYSGHQSWLSGEHMHAFHQRLDRKTDSFTHRIIDRTGKTTSAHWGR